MSRFDSFWEQWPSPKTPAFCSYSRKADKAKCCELWEKRKYDEEADVILQDVVQRKKYDRGWLQQDGAFLCAPLVYLRNRRWEDGEFADVRDEKKKRAAAYVARTEQDSGPEVSRYGQYANRYLLQSLLKRRGLQDDEKLSSVIRAKNEVVAIAEADGANGQRWEDEDFVSVIRKTIDEALSRESSRSEAA